MIVLITLTSAGEDTGPTFDLYSDVDNYTTPFETEIPKATLLAGYESNSVPDGTTIIRVVSHDNIICINYINLTISLFTTSTTSTTTSTTTAIPIYPISYDYTNTCGEPTCVKSSGTISVNGNVAYAWYAGTNTPDGGIITAEIGDTIEIDGISYISGIGCIEMGLLSTLTYYVNGINVADAIDGPVTYSFIYNGEGTISIEKGCSVLT